MSDNREDREGSGQTPGNEKNTLLADIPTGEETRVSLLDQLTVKEYNFLKYLINPDSPTYSNKTRSYMLAYDRENYHTCATEAHRVLKKPKIQRAYRELLNRAGLSRQDLVATLSDIIHNKTTQTTHKQGTAGGKAVDIIETRDVSVRDRLQAIHIVNKLSGDYDLTRAAVHQQTKEYADLRKRMMRHVGSNTHTTKNTGASTHEDTDAEG